MHVRGVAFLGREAMTVDEHGPAAWRAFVDDHAKREPFFAQKILPITPIPADKFITFNEALVKALYAADPKAFWNFGVRSAEWSLTRGQNKDLFKPGEYRRFLFACAPIWSSYYDAGHMSVTAGKDGATDVKVLEVPIAHTYFEHSVMAYLVHGLERLGAKKLRYEAVRGFSLGHPDVHYRFWVE